MSEYYVPSKEELFLGYSCEYKGFDEKWYPITITGMNINAGEPDYIRTKASDLLFIFGNLRTKYLSEQDLLDYGWKGISSAFGQNILIKYFGTEVYSVEFLTDRIIRIFTQDHSEYREKVLFEGECKSINDFHRIANMIKMYNNNEVLHSTDK